MIKVTEAELAALMKAYTAERDEFFVKCDLEGYWIDGDAPDWIRGVLRRTGGAKAEETLGKILNTVSDLASAFLYYDRKEDEDLPVGAIEQAVLDGVIAEKTIVEAFALELARSVAAKR